jgi:hypothetical protein
MVHEKTCANGCVFVDKHVINPKVGGEPDYTDYLHRCKKLNGRVIQNDSIIFQLGCASFSLGECGDQSAKAAETLVKEAETLLKKINDQIETQKGADKP